jgi:DHA1 family bicyclomycin/chloramphenicol resistance-like MFS transporter
LGISNPNTAALTLQKNAGSASALMGAIQLGLGAFAFCWVFCKRFNGTYGSDYDSQYHALIFLSIGKRNIIVKH